MDAATAREFVGAREALDAQRPGVAGQVQRVQEPVPVEVVGADGAAVVAADLHVGDVPHGPGHRRRDVPLLDVQVEGVKRQPQPGAEQRLEGVEGLVDGVDQGSFVAVQRFDLPG